MAVAPSIPPDTLLGGKIRLVQKIGRGGMGDVWIARNEATEAEVAVKTLVRAERNGVNDERFRREARLAATVTHRNVVRIFDLIDDTGGTLGLVMELLRGGTLEACLRDRGSLSTIHAVAVAVPILSALHHVHQKGIIHRDVKPANIFFAVEPDGHVIPKILDFGIAKLPAAGSALTMDGSVLGTPHYMSPEQIRGAEDLDGRSDMFSVAVLLYEMLTGVRVFQRDTAAASLAAVLEHDVDPDPRIEPRLWVALSRALAKRPYERYATCAELAEAIRAALDASDEDLAQSLQELRPRSDATPESGPHAVEMASEASRARRRRRKRNTLAWALAAAGGAAALAVTLTLAATRSGAGASANAQPGISAAGPSGAVVLGTATVPRDVVPPPAAPDSASDPTPARPATTSARPAPPPPIARPAQTALGRPASPPPTARLGTARPGDPATRPGF